MHIRLILLFSLLNFSLGQAQPASQTIKGVIIDGQSKYPLPGATVMVLNTSALLGSTSDETGSFSLRQVPLGYQTVRISFLGYRERIIPNVLVTAGKEVSLTVELTEQMITAQEVIVKARRDQTSPVNELALVSVHSFNPEATNRFAGSRGDPARMASNYAGVSGANDNRNDIIVRGNSPLGLLWQLEGINIPNPNHYGALGTTGGPVSMLNNNVLDRSDFLTAAFPAQYGNAIAGVFDLNMRTGNADKSEYLAQMGFNGFELGAEGPLSKKDKARTGGGASYLVNYRYSTLAVFNALGLDLGLGTAVPQYQDLSLKVDIPTGRNGHFSVFGLGGLSGINLLGSTMDTTKQDLFGDENQDMRSGYRTGIVGSSYQHHLSPTTFYKLTVAGSYTDQWVTTDSLSRQNWQPVRLEQTRHAQTKYSINGIFNKKLSVKDLFTAGFTLDWFTFSLHQNRYEPAAANDQSVLRQSGQSRLIQFYGQWQHRFSERLVVNGGLHGQHFALTNSRVIEPRLGLKYQLNDRQSVRLGYGEHSQLQPLTSYFVQTPATDNAYRLTNTSLDFTRSRHLALAYERSLSASLHLKVETYYQGIRQAPVDPTTGSFSMLNAGASFDLPDNDSLVNRGHGRNYGLELTLERSYQQGFYFLTTVSLFDSNYQGSDGVWRNTAFNGHYVVNLLAGRAFKTGHRDNTFNVDWKLTTAGGRYETPIDYARSVRAGRAVYHNEAAYSEQLRAYFRTDLKFSYRLNRRRLTHEISLDLQNFTGQQNVFTRTYNNRTQQLATQYQIGFFPVPQYRLLF
ncbi:TonB-dependent receptor [Spirosoma pollinicola]|uniref:TonB-dependent receptor n=2 Tax=Spirosoma pollinicola TaxID=2057025 RepID=A0A2K8Z2I8_9BACT|nr:TonB-dependent receptor [Spirosoma pollinicola]AUD04044.1 TonB-dependent receptor [Spirosoma pollinicola]